MSLERSGDVFERIDRFTNTGGLRLALSGAGFGWLALVGLDVWLRSPALTGVPFVTGFMAIAVGFLAANVLGREVADALLDLPATETVGHRPDDDPDAPRPYAYNGVAWHTGSAPASLYATHTAPLRFDHLTAQLTERLDAVAPPGCSVAASGVTLEVTLGARRA